LWSTYKSNLSDVQSENECLSWHRDLKFKFEQMFMAYNDLRLFRRVVTCVRKGEMFLLREARDVDGIISTSTEPSGRDIRT